MPLTSLLMAGEAVDEVLLGAVQELFPVEVAVPNRTTGSSGLG